MKFRILGPVCMQNTGYEIPIAGAKKKTMLAALLLSGGRAVPDTQLGEMLWGRDYPKTYQAQIYTYASRLRNQLSDDAQIVRQGAGYQLIIGSSRFDYAEFEKFSRRGTAALKGRRYQEAAELLHSALDLWNGVALTGVTESFAQMERPRLEEIRLDTLEDRIDADIMTGRHERLLPELLSLVRAHPLRERIRAQYMRTLYRSSRQAEALRTYHEGLALLKSELGVSPGPLLRSTYQSILDEEAPPERPKMDGRVVSIRPTQPSAYAGIPDFIGRSENLNEFTMLTRPQEQGDIRRQRPVVVVTGMAGVGKTTFAMEAANLRGGHFSDGQVIADLHGSTEHPASLSQTLNTLLGALGVEYHETPDDMQRRLHLYHDRLADRKMLIILDDAADERHIRPLVPRNPDCQVLVTSRMRLSGLEGQRTIGIASFNPEESLSLFTQILGRSRVQEDTAAAHRILDSCAGLPLAVRIAGARALAKEHWPLTRLADQLSDPGRVLDELRLGDLDVHARLLDSCRLLDAQTRTTLVRLARSRMSAFPRMFTGDVLGMGAPRGELAAENLVDVHLLKHAGTSPAGQPMYQFPRLVWLVARELPFSAA